MINNENNQINLNQKEISLPDQSQNIEDKTNQKDIFPLFPPFSNDQNSQNFIPNNNIQQYTEINQNINGNFQNNNNYNSPYSPQINYQPNIQQNNALQPQIRNNNCCCRNHSPYSPYDCLAGLIGTIIGLSLVFLVTSSIFGFNK